MASSNQEQSLMFADAVQDTLQSLSVEQVAQFNELGYLVLDVVGDSDKQTKEKKSERRKEEEGTQDEETNNDDDDEDAATKNPSPSPSYYHKIPTSLMTSFLEEIQTSWKQHWMSPNKVEFLINGGKNSIQLVKPNIYEQDLHELGSGGGGGDHKISSSSSSSPSPLDAIKAQVKQSTLPHFTRLMQTELDTLAGHFNTTWPSLSLVRNSEKPNQIATVKMQINTGEGSFPWHYDNPSPPNKRKLTMAIYLCPEWSNGCGGEICLMPFLRPVIRVAPKFGRLVLFRSDMMLHSVRLTTTVTPPTSLANPTLQRIGKVTPEESTSTAASFTRYCFTIWFDSTEVNADEEVNLRAKHLALGAEAAAAAATTSSNSKTTAAAVDPSTTSEKNGIGDFISTTMMTTPLQRALSRVVYEEEYRESLMECFGGFSSCLSSSSALSNSCKNDDNNDGAAAAAAALLLEKQKQIKIALSVHEAHIKPLLASAEKNEALGLFISELRRRKELVKGQYVALS